jgi:hypothetical protein
MSCSKAISTVFRNMAKSAPKVRVAGKRVPPGVIRAEWLRVSSRKAVGRVATASSVRLHLFRILDFACPFRQVCTVLADG